jgi:hypothetical protein
MKDLAQEGEDKIGAGLSARLYFELTQGFLFVYGSTLKAYLSY